MSLQERLLSVANEMDGSGQAEAAVVAAYIRDELIPLADDPEAVFDANGAVDSLAEIGEWVTWAQTRVKPMAVELTADDTCSACDGTGRDILSSDDNWLPCQDCDGLGKVRR